MTTLAERQAAEIAARWGRQPEPWGHREKPASAPLMPVVPLTPDGKTWEEEGRDSARALSYGTLAALAVIVLSVAYIGGHVVVAALRGRMW